MTLEGKKIIVADDNGEFRAEFISQLTEMGFEVVGEAADGVELINLIAELSPDLVFIDVVMPEMDGIEALQIIRKRWGSLPSVVVSVLSGEARFTSAYEHLIPKQCFLSKPVDSGMLLRACNVAFGFEYSEYGNNEEPAPEGSEPSILLGDSEEQASGEDVVPPPPLVKAQ